MPQLTGKPVRDKLVASDIRVYGIRDLEKRLCSIIYATLSIQGFTLVLLLVCMVDPNETVGRELRLGKLDAEFLDCFLEIRYFFFVRWTWLTEARRMATTNVLEFVCCV